jgi:hypothetical protein
VFASITNVKIEEEDIKMFGRNILIIIINLLVIYSYSQGNYHDVLYLKNGSIIRGIITENIIGKKIKMETADGNIFIFSYYEIEKIVKEKLKKNNIAKEKLMNDDMDENQKKEIKIQENNVVSKSIKNSYMQDEKDGIERYNQQGFVQLTRFGGYFAGKDLIFFINAVAAAQIGSHFVLGVGGGWEKLPNGTNYPFFADIRTNILSGQLSPIFFIDIGYSLSTVDKLEGSNYGGLMLCGGIGLRVFLSERSAINFEIGYRYQEAKAYVLLWRQFGNQKYSYDGTVDYTYSSICFSIGFSF